MSVFCIDLTNAIVCPSQYVENLSVVLKEYDASVEAGKANPQPVVQAIINELCARWQDGQSSLPDEIALLLDDDPTLSVPLGRIGVRDIISSWARKQYPGADREVVITLKPSDDTVHVLLVYIGNWSHLLD